MRTHRSTLPSLLTLALLAACGPAADDAGDAAHDGEESPGAVLAEPAAPPPVATITGVRGPAGVRTDDLPEGTYLGTGSRLIAGQRLSVPVGSLAELRTEAGAIVRLNEGAVVVLPDPEGGRELALERGELVAIVAAGQPPLRVQVGEDALELTGGEARALRRGAVRSYDLVYGTASLIAPGGRTMALLPGTHIADAGAPDPRPAVSLQPLEETAWSHAFELAAAAVDGVPAGVGSLTARRAGSTAELHRLALTEQRVHVSISGRIAHTQIEQTFYNEAPEVLEGTYRFPLPPDASISGLSLLVGDTWIDAEMLEKQRARQIFKKIVDATIPRDPALLEWERGNIFKMKIFPIPGRGARKIRLSYTQVLPAVGDDLRYRFPLSGSGATSEEIGDFQFTVAVDRAELPDGAEVRTPMTTLERRVLDDRVELSTRAQRFRPVHDLGVDLPLPPAEKRMHAETLLDRDGQAYFMLALKPELALPAAARPTHYAFVLDRSHSITPELWTVARGLLRAVTGTLAADDRMTVLACDAACDAAPGGLLPAATGLPAADDFLDHQALAGASDIGGMMRAAADALGPEDPAVDRVIVYLGDGEPSAGELAPDELLRHLEAPLAGVRVQAVALGARADTFLLGALTRSSGGDLLRADARDDLRALVRELRLRAAVPVARRVELSLPKEMVEVHPTSLAAVRPGDTVLLVGKLRGPARGAVEIRATGPSGQVVTDSFPVDLAALPGEGAGRHTHLPRTWARQEIDALTATRGYAARADIVALSREYNVLSRFTALIALESDAMYREFNVVRQSGNTTGWNGQLAGQKAPTTATEVPTDDADTAPKEQPADEATAPARRTRGEEAEPEADLPAEPARKGEKSDSLANEDPPAPADLGLTGAGRGGGGTGEADIGLGGLGTIGKSAGGVGSGYGRGAGAGFGGRGVRYEDRWTITAAKAAAGTALGRLVPLQQAVDRDPTSRPAHRALVLEAIRLGAPDAFAYASGWAHADPDHAPALLAVADLLAARGDAAAPRAYGSAVEVDPFDLGRQTRQADALEFKGDLARSCAHRRAVVSIDPKRPDHHLQLVRCLTALGLAEPARAAAEDGIARARGDVKALRAALTGHVSPARSRGARGPMTATVTWTGDGDVDLALVDRRGRRLSGLRGEALFVAQEGASETVSPRSTGADAFSVEVTRATGTGPVSGEVTIRVPGESRSFPFTLETGTLRLAAVNHDPWARVFGTDARVSMLDAQLKVIGSIDRDIIRRITRAHINEIRYCYSRGLQRSPSARGVLVVDFAISGTGQVPVAQLARSSVHVAEIEQCVLTAIRRWQFPKAEGVVRVTMPFRLQTE